MTNKVTANQRQKEAGTYVCPHLQLLTCWSCDSSNLLIGSLHRYRVKDKSDRATVEQVRIVAGLTGSDPLNRLTGSDPLRSSAGAGPSDSDDSVQDAESRNHQRDQRLHQHREGGQLTWVLVPSGSDRFGAGGLGVGCCGNQ